MWGKTLRLCKKKAKSKLCLKYGPILDRKEVHGIVKDNQIDGSGLFFSQMQLSTDEKERKG